VAPGSLTYTVQFNEPMLATNLDASDYSLLGVFRNTTYTASSASYNPAGTVLTLNYLNLPEDKYTLTLLSANGRFEDAAGNDLDGEPVWPNPPNASGNGTAGGNFLVNYFVDNPTLAFPAPLASSNPLGSLVYSGSTTTVVAGSSDTDSFTLSVDAGQTITVVSHPSGSLQSTIALQAPDGTTLGTATAPAAGQDASLQTIAASAAGMYTFAIGGDNCMTGVTSGQVILNAASES